MKSLISINDLFMSVSPHDMVELIKKSKYVEGTEITLDCTNTDHIKYLDNLVYEIKKNNMVLQIHGKIETPLSKQIEFFKKLEDYSSYLGYPMIVTLHTIYDEDMKLSLEKTSIYISNLIKEIDNNKVIICLENLNDTRTKDRLGKEEIKELVLNYENLYFTYDIGHEISNYGNITDLDEYMINDIRNVHIHTIDGKGNDHVPIYKNDNYWNELIKALIFLINNKYQGNIAYEYLIDYCHGNTLEEKIIDYLNSIDYVSEKYK